MALDTARKETKEKTTEEHRQDMSEGTSSAKGLVKKPRILQKQSIGVFSGASTTGILTVDNVPQGTYKVTIGAREFQADPDESCFINPQLGASGGATSNIIVDGSANWIIGPANQATNTGEQAVLEGYTSTRIIDFSNSLNRFELNLSISANSSMSYPWYILEKIDDLYEEITTEWD